MAQQRKQVTILFIHLAGLSHLAEENRTSSRAQAIWQTLEGIITNHQGLVNPPTSDTTLALFGAPTARENDAERAVRAAIVLHEAVAEYNKKGAALPIQLYVSISTGSILFNTFQFGNSFMAIGEAVNVANMLLRHFPEEKLILAQDTYNLIRGTFEVNPLKEVFLPEKKEPLIAYQLIQEKPRAIELASTDIEGVEIKLIGRDEELELVQQTANHITATKTPAIITITGETGVGKSRLLHEFTRWIELLHHFYYLWRGRASQQTNRLPYGFIREIFAERFLIQESDPASVARKKLETGFVEFMGPEGIIAAHFLGQLIGYDFQKSPHIQEVIHDAQQIRDRAFQYAAKLFQSVAEIKLEEDAGLLILLDDIQWSDSGSLDLIEYVLKHSPNSPILLIAISWPDLWQKRPNWGKGFTNHSPLPLNPLSPEYSGELIRHILRRVKNLPVSLVDFVTSQAEGNPLFIEELIKMLIESNVIETNNNGWVAFPEKLSTAQIPSTLTGVLQSGFDILPTAEQETLQKAAVVGRVFWDDTITHLSITEDRPIEWVRKYTNRVLNDLQKKGLIEKRKETFFAGATEYQFKHSMLHEITYQTILIRKRNEYHKRVADWLIKTAPDRLSEFTGIIADHLEHAGEYKTVIYYLSQAAEQSRANFANNETIDYLNRAIALSQDQTEKANFILARERMHNLQGKREIQKIDIEQLITLLPKIPEEHQLSIKLQTMVQQAKLALHISDHATALAIAREIISLSKETPEFVELEIHAHLISSRALHAQSEDTEGKTEAELALKMARQQQDIKLVAESLRDLGNIATDRNYFDLATDYYRESIEIYRQLKDKRGESSSLNNLANVVSNQGNHALAHTYYEQGMRIDIEIGDRPGLAKKLNNLGTTCGDMGDYAKAWSYFEQSQALEEELHQHASLGTTCNNLGYIARHLGQYAQAVIFHKKALTICDETNNPRLKSLQFSNLSLVLHSINQQQLAKENAEKSIELAHQVDTRHIEAYGWNHLGHALVALDQAKEAILAYSEGIRLREELGQLNLSMEVRSGLAEAYVAMGDLDQALVQIEIILAHLEEHSLDGTLEPFRIRLNCIHILDAHQDVRAQKSLQIAHSELQTLAAKIGDLPLRQSYLEKVTANREIINLAQKRL